MGYFFVATVVVLSLVPPPTFIIPKFRLGDKLIHFGTYGFLMMWFAQIFIRPRYLKIAVAFIFMGVSLEFLQALTPYRTLDFWDMLANSIGVVLGWGLALKGADRIFDSFEKKLKPS
jgi:VanZ family protein